jgi:hypothetical protein
MVTSTGEVCWTISADGGFGGVEEAECRYRDLRIGDSDRQERRGCSAQPELSWPLPRLAQTYLKRQARSSSMLDQDAGLGCDVVNYEGFEAAAVSYLPVKIIKVKQSTDVRTSWK